MTETPKTKLGEKLGFAAFSASNNAVYQFKNIYLLFFMTNVLGLPVGWAGMVITAGTVWDAVNDPLLGYWAVNRRFRSGEAVRPFALWHSVPWAASTVLLFTDFHVGRVPAMAIALAAYLLFEVFNTTVGITHNTMAGLATNRDADRHSINVFRNLGSGAGAAIGAVACLPLLELFGALNKEGNLTETGGPRGFLLVAAVMSLIIVAGSFAHYFTTKERVPQPAAAERLSFGGALRMLLSSRSWIFNAVYLIGYNVINQLLMSNLAYYATYVQHSTAAAMNIQVVYLGGSLLASFFVGALDSRLGRRRTMMLGAGIAIAGKAWFLADPVSAGAIYLNALTVGISITIAFVLFNTNRGDIADILQARHGRRIDSMVSSVDSLASKLAVAGATLLGTSVLGRAGFDAELAAQPASAISVLNFMLGWAPAITSAVMLACAALLPIEREYREAKERLENQGKEKTE